MIRVDEVDAAITRELRLAVLRGDPRHPGPVPGDGPGAVHLAARDGDSVIGAGAVLPERWRRRPDVDGAWQLRGMAVSPHAQGRGVGTLVLAAAVAAASARGATLLWCTARTSALGFYERHGWRAEGPEFVVEVVGLPHRDMCREPAAVPTSS